MRSFLVNVGYGLNVVMLGLVSFSLAAEGSGAVAILVPLIIGVLAVVMGWLALQDQRNQRLGKTGRIGSLLVPAAAVLVFLFMAGGAASLEGQRPRVFLYVAMALMSVQTLGLLWLLSREGTRVMKIDAV